MSSRVSPPKRSSLAELLILAAPIIGMTVSRMAMGFIDFVMVSRLGTEAQAAISPATVLVFAVVCIGMGAASSVQTFASQADGRGEPKEGSGYVWQTLFVGIALSLLSIPVIGCVPAFFEWVGAHANHAPRVRQMEAEYTTIALWCALPSVLCAGLNGFFNGIQRPGVSFLAVFVSLLFNVVANYALIFGHFGFPALGIQGAAIATVLAWWVRAAVLLAVFVSRSFAERYGTRESIRVDWQKLRGIVRGGAPISVQWFLDIVSWSFFMLVIIPPFGTVAMAASNAALQFMHLSFMPAVGVGLALCSQVGFAIGERKHESAVLRARTAMRVTMTYMGSIGVLFYVARYPLMGLVSDDADVVEAGALALTWAAVFQLFDALNITFANALQGAGDTRFTAMVGGFCCWGIFIGGGWLLAISYPEWYLNGPWLMCTLYIITLGILLWRRFRSGLWKSIELFDCGRSGSDVPVGV